MTWKDRFHQYVREAQKRAILEWYRGTHTGAYIGRHPEEWYEHPHPMLGGQSPRELVDTGRGGQLLRFLHGLTGSQFKAEHFEERQ